MRLPLTTTALPRDSLSDKDGRMVNALKETDNGRDHAATRPALSFVASTTAGAGNGLAVFDVLISVVGGTIRYDTTLTSIGAVVDARYDFIEGTGV